ncbi:hypothetical protein [Herminiimonas sp. CN]|uniref:hypothetical protein n=1 Tax=Herminiimonas sp. CN TaxID=1349818 RepID=UPI0012DF85DF|nr:hypothetical protein [Herminiimonas sp. CN]
MASVASLRMMWISDKTASKLHRTGALEIAAMAKYAADQRQTSEVSSNIGHIGDPCLRPKFFQSGQYAAYHCASCKEAYNPRHIAPLCIAPLLSAS